MNTPLNLTAATTHDIAALEGELRSGLELFWRTAATILDDGPIRLTPPDETSLSLPRNFFSMLFLYSYYRLGVPAERRILYAAVNQCLRGMVTGCDNLLDDEYKTTLETDLPLQAHRFRSVLDIMVADRVLFAVLTDHCRAHGVPVDLALQASSASLRALIRSGAQEAAEEEGIAERIAPEIVLEQIHHDKTGVLFQSPWAVPSILEPDLPPEAATVKEALYQIGIGCQILDDLVDLFRDVRQQRHNYVASVIVHREPPELWRQVQTLVTTEPTPDRLYEQWPDFTERMRTEAMTTIEQGLRALFFDRHHDLVRPAAMFVASRIGAPVAP